MKFETRKTKLKFGDGMTKNNSLIEIKGSNLRLTLESSCLEIEGRLAFPLGGHPAYIFKKELVRVKRRFDPFSHFTCRARHTTKAFSGSR